MSPVTFKLMIGLDFAENTSVGSLADHEKAVSKLSDQELKDRASAYPWRFANSIAFPIATFQRQNNCELRLVLSDGSISDNVRCENINDNNLVSFQFPHWIKPGLYSVTLESTGEAGQEVAPYYTRDNQQKAWIVPFQGKSRVCFWDYIKSLVNQSPYLATAYIVILIIVLMIQMGSFSFKWVVLSAYVSTLLFTNIATLPLSGHDETAHLSMYHEALKLNKLTPLSDAEFNLKTWQTMAAADFFRLNSIPPRLSSDCPHMILYSCGFSDSPIALYRFYSKTLNAIGIAIYEPIQIEFIARIINFILIISMVSIAFILLKTANFTSFVLALTFFNAMTIQSATLTNDIPMYLLGCLGLLTLISAINNSYLLFFCSSLVFISAYIITKKVDISSTTAVPWVGSILFLLLFKSNSFRKIVEKNHEKSLWFGADILFLVASIVITILVAKIVSVSELSMKFILEFEGRALLIQDFGKVAIQKSWPILWAYWKSFIGSYVWGHSYWSAWTYFVSFGFLLTFSIIGMQKLRDSSINTIIRLTHLSLIGGLLAIQLFSLLCIAIAASDFPDEISRDSFAKVRLSAPTATALLLLVGLVGENLKLEIFARIWIVFFTMLAAFWMPTRFFFADIF